MDIASRDSSNSLNRTLSKMEMALEAIADAIVWTDFHQQIEWYNPAFDRLINHPQQSLVGSYLSELLPLFESGQSISPERYPDIRARQGDYQPQEYQFWQGEQYLTLEITARCVNSDSAETVVLILRNVTQLRQVTAEQQRVEQEQQKVLSLLRATLESTADGVLVVTRDRNTPLYNQKFLQMWGVSEDLMQPGRADERLRALGEQTKDPAGFMTRVWELFRDRLEETALEMLEFKDGRIFERYSQPLRNGDQIIGRVWNFRDVAEQRRNEQALQQQATAIKASIDGIAILDANQTYVYLNESHARIYGYDSTQELIGKNWRLFYDEAEISRFEQEIFPTFLTSGHWQGEAIGVRRDGSRFPQEVSLSATKSGGLVCIVRDISSRKQAEVALKQAEERYRSIFENAVVGIYQTTPNGHYLGVNPTLAQMHGYESPEEMMTALTDIAHQMYVNPESREDFKQLLTENDTVTEFEAQVYRKDGSIIWVSENARTVRDAVGNILYYEGTSIDISERKQAEQALRDSEERLRLALEAGRMGIWDWNILTGEVKWSDNLEEVHGMAPGSFGGTFEEFLQVVHPHDREWVNQQISQAIDSGADYDIEFRILWADGSVHWIAGKGQTFRDDTGKPIRMIGTGMDITERKRTQEALQQSEERLRLTLDFSRIGIWSWDLVTGELNASEEAMRLVGLEPGTVEVTYQLWRDLVHPDDIDRVEQAITQALETRTDYDAEYRVIYPNGTIHWIVARGRCVYAESGQPLKMLGVLICNTDRKLAEEALRESEEKLRLTLEFTKIGTWEWDLLGDEMLLDERSKQILQIAPHEAGSHGDAWCRRIHPDEADQVMQALNDCREHHTDFAAEYRLIRPDGSIRWLMDQGRGVYDESGRALRMLGVLIDITDRKLAEEAMSQSEARFRALYEATRLPIFLLDENGAMACNQAAADIMGCDREALVGSHPIDFSPPFQPGGQDSASLAEQHISYALQQGNHRFEWVHRRFDGTDFPAEVWLTAVEVGDRRLLQAIVQDLTERKQVETALAEQASLEAFRADVDSALAQSDRLPVMLQRCAAAVVVHLNAAFARIWTFNDEENVLELRASAGMYIHLDGPYERVPVGTAKIGQIAQQRQPIVSNTLQDDPPCLSGSEWAREEGLVAFAGYPLLLGDRLMGVVAMFSRKPITESISEALGFAASEIGLGIARKRAEAALRESEIKFRTIVENANDVIFALTPAGEVSYISPNVFYTHGYNPSELQGQQFVNYIHPEDLPQSLEAFNLAFATNIKQSGIEYRSRHKDGHWLWQTANLSVSQDVDGRSLLVGVARDITERKRAEEALRESEAQYRDLVETANCIIIRWDTDGVIRFINDYGQQFFGYQSSEILHRNVVGTIVPELETSGRNLKQMIEDMRFHPERYATNENENTRKNGDRVWIVWANRAVLDEHGNMIEILSVGTDATDRKRAEERIQESFNLLNGVIEGTSDCIFVKDLQGRYVLVNRATVEAFERPAETIVGFDDFAILPHDAADAIKEVDAEILANGSPITFEEKLPFHGEICTFLTTKTPYRDGQGNIIGLIGIARDISVLKQNEEALRQAHQQLEFHIENSPLAVVEWDEELRVKKWSLQAERLFGWTMDELVGNAWDDWKFIFEADQAQVGQIASRLVDGRDKHNISYNRNYTKDGRVLDCEWYNSVLFDDSGKVVSILSLIQDVSDRKQAEEALRRSELKFRNIFNNSQVGIFRTRIEDGLILEANQKYIEFTGYDSPEEVIGKRYSTEFYVDPARRERMLEEIQEVGSVKNFEMQFRRLDGSIRWGMYSIYLNQEENCLEGVITDITDRRQAEDALHRSEAKYRNIFENSHAGIGRTRLEDGMFLDVNQRYAEIMGFSSPADLIGKRFNHEFYADPSDRDRLISQLEQHGEVRNFEEQLRRPDGSTAWGLLSLRLNREENCIDFVIADISKRKQLEEELSEKQQFLDSIINNIPLALFTKDIRNNFNYVLINQNSDRILGFPREGAIGKNDYDLLPKEVADLYREQDTAAIASGTLLEIPEYPIHAGDETILARSLKLPLFDSQGDPTYLLCISEDITERKRQQEALRLIVEGTASKTGDDFFRTCVRYLAEVLQVHCAFVTEWANENWTKARILAIWVGGEFTRNFEIELGGTPCENVVAGKQVYFYPDSVPSLFPNDPYIDELQAESYLGIPLLGSSGNMLGYLAVTDTKPMEPDPGRELILKIFAARAGAELERHQAEKALMLAKEAAETANRSKSTFLANMSHELRTPLNSILGFTQLMVRDSTLAVQQRQFLETINRSGEHLLTLINDVLEMSKIEAGRTTLKPEPFDLHLLLQTVYEMFEIRSHNKRLSLEFEVASNLPQYVITDEGKLRQVLINLLNNAIKFTQKGRVTLRVKTQEPETTLTPTPDTRYPTPHIPTPNILYFEVEDTGIGIATGELEHLFQPFVQTSSSAHAREGTGLGLAISRQFVQLMGGSIAVTSVADQGSTFSFEIPFTLADPAEVVVTVKHGRVIGLAPDQPIYRILVVDDRAENRELIAQLLTSVGFEVQTANDGREAIAQWQSWHPQLIWMDMRMPVMDGYEATRRIRDVESRVLLCVKNSTKIIALTASAFDEQQSSILEAGCDDLVLKPFREEVIFAKMATHLGVQYVYEETESPEDSSAPGKVRKDDLTSSMAEASASVSIMPPEWIAQLHQAALAVDAGQILALVEQIPESDRALADKLKDLVQHFNFDEILELTGL